MRRVAPAIPLNDTPLPTRVCWYAGPRWNRDQWLIAFKHDGGIQRKILRVREREFTWAVIRR